MDISFPEYSKLETSRYVTAAHGPRLKRAISSECLYRRAGLCVILVLGMLWVPRSFGQGDKPQLKRPSEDRPERPEEKKRVKKGKDPRAVGVLEFKNGKGTLVPVAILIDGRFYDASVYKADPIPMALESGTVYEAEQAGEGQGLFTVNGALHSKNPGSAHAWMGNGTFLAQGAEAPKGTRKAEDIPVGMESSGDEPPRLTRKTSNKADTDTDAATTRPAAKVEDSKGSGSAAGASDKPAEAEAKAASPPVAQKTDEKSEKPRPESQSGATNPPSPSPTPQQDAYYRPTLRRGKPTQAAPEEQDVPIAKKTSAAGGSGSSISGDVGNVRTVAAISDAGGPGPQSYRFFWKTGEEEERRGQMLTLAGNEVRAYAAALVKNQIPAKPAGSKSGAGKRMSVAKPVEPVLENVQFRGFDVWVTNQPLMILSAEAHFPVVPGVAASTAEPYSITLVARTDIYGNLRKVFSGVTDRFHLDVTPRLELIDAVDADGDGRAELLFRETSDAGSGYVIYRATADKLWKMFDSLNAE